MVKILKTTDKSFEKDFENLLQKRNQDDQKIDKKVAKIIDDVKLRSDKALIDLTKT